MLSWQVSAASAEVVAGDHEEEDDEEEGRGTAMEQAKGSGEVSATDARADAGVEEDCWWCVLCVCVCAVGWVCSAWVGPGVSPRCLDVAGM